MVLNRESAWAAHAGAHSKAQAGLLGTGLLLASLLLSGLLTSLLTIVGLLLAHLRNHLLLLRLKHEFPFAVIRAAAVGLDAGTREFTGDSGNGRAGILVAGGWTDARRRRPRRGQQLLDHIEAWSGARRARRTPRNLPRRRLPRQLHWLPRELLLKLLALLRRNQPLLRQTLLNRALLQAVGESWRADNPTGQARIGLSLVELALVELALVDLSLIEPLVDLAWIGLGESRRQTLLIQIERVESLI